MYILFISSIIAFVVGDFCLYEASWGNVFAQLQLEWQVKDINITFNYLIIQWMLKFECLILFHHQITLCTWCRQFLSHGSIILFGKWPCTRESYLAFRYYCPGTNEKQFANAHFLLDDFLCSRQILLISLKNKWGFIWHE